LSDFSESFSDFHKNKNGNNVRKNVKLEFCNIVAACLRGGGESNNVAACLRGGGGSNNVAACLKEGGGSTHGQEFSILPTLGTLQRQAKTSSKAKTANLFIFHEKDPSNSVKSNVAQL
jgi:hypothetical protein